MARAKRIAFWVLFVAVVAHAIFIAGTTEDGDTKALAVQCALLAVLITARSRS